MKKNKGMGKEQKLPPAGKPDMKKVRLQKQIAMKNLGAEQCIKK